MSPLRALRESLAQLPNHIENATQAGFARLIGRSESLVRAVESGRVPMSEKLIRDLSLRFGVPADLLKKNEVTEADAPAIVGAINNALIEKQVEPGKWIEPDPKRRLRRTLISSVSVAMDDLFSVCSNEELAVVTSELRELMYSRLAKMAEQEGALEAKKSEVTEGDDVTQSSN